MRYKQESRNWYKSEHNCNFAAPMQQQHQHLQQTRSCTRYEIEILVFLLYFLLYD